MPAFSCDKEFWIFLSPPARGGVPSPRGEGVGVWEVEIFAKG